MTLNNKEIDKILLAISSSVQRVYLHDNYLIQNKVHERSIVGRFAIYFQEELNQIGYSGFHLDVEYNKDHSHPKRTTNFSRGTYPDVVVHQRGSNENNLCIIEFKPQWSRVSIDRDIKKLKDFTDEKGKYKYGIGFSIIINHNIPHIQRVQKGMIIENPKY
ncbi:MAG: hypothetical protein WCS59_00590 [Sphaerochaetaceae bacterium]|jgi:hypothetical protein|nr:hypothetical protein [Sphaerochaetaceae bacterium]